MAYNKYWRDRIREERETETEALIAYIESLLNEDKND